MDRIWAHIIGGWSGNLGHAWGAKLVDVSLGYVRKVRQALGPDALLIVRWVESLGEQERLVRLGAEGARQWYAKRRLEMLAMDQLDPRIAFEGLNEIPDAYAASYCAFEVERLRLMQADALCAVVGNFSVGVPDVVMWATYEPMLRAMGPGDLLGLHEYWVDSADLENPWHVGRWRLVPRLQSVPIVVTECGRDVVEGRGWAGWQRSCGGAEMVADLRHYDEILAQAPNVAGACVFQMGSRDARWRPFDMSSQWPSIVSGYSGRLPVEMAPVAAPKEESVSIPIDGRLMSVDTFRAHVATLDLSRVKRVVIHHTYKPDEGLWRTYGGWEYWKHALKREFESRRNADGTPWTRGPHLFVSYEGVGLFYDMTKTGRAVGGGSLEEGCLHIEVVGSFMKAVPQGDTLANAVGVAAILIDKTRADLTNHQKVLGRPYECPGLALQAAWGWFAGLVADAVKALQTPIEEPAYLPEMVEAEVWEPVQVLEKARWWLEEEQRQREAGDAARADAIHRSLVTWMLECELRLKAG